MSRFLVFVGLVIAFFVYVGYRNMDLLKEAVSVEAGLSEVSKYALLYDINQLDGSDSEGTLEVKLFGLASATLNVDFKRLDSSGLLLKSVQLLKVECAGITWFSDTLIQIETLSPFYAYETPDHAVDNLIKEVVKEQVFIDAVKLVCDESESVQEKRSTMLTHPVRLISYIGQQSACFVTTEKGIFFLQRIRKRSGLYIYMAPVENYEFSIGRVAETVKAFRTVIERPDWCQLISTNLDGSLRTLYKSL